MIKFANEKETCAAIVEAMKSGDAAATEAAFAAAFDAVAEQVKADFEDAKASNDSAILAQRGYRQLTSKENKWYQRVIDALKSDNPKQAFTQIIGTEAEDDLMPTTIIDDVYRDLEHDHPLLAAVNFVNVGYLTKWVMNDHATQLAVWGAITDEIVKEITSAFKVVDIEQSKLTAFAIIEKGMLDLGPTFLDGYIRKVLALALACGLENAIINGTGVDMPVGLIKDIHKGVSFSTETGYPNKEKKTVKDFLPATYGALCAEMAETENGKPRTFGKVQMIVNQKDYLTKIMPATTVLTSAGTYANNVFPIPTDVIVSNEVEEGSAVLCLLNEYFLGVGGSKSGTIEYSDEYKFIEDQRAFKIKQYATGRAADNTCALYLDISGIQPAYITVKNVDAIPSA